MPLRPQQDISLSNPRRHPPSREALRGLVSSEVNWDKWSRHIESRRRRLNGRHPFDGPLTAPALLAEATFVSFRLEGLDVTDAQTLHALSGGKQPRTLRSRTSQRLRNHAALLHEVDNAVKSSQPIEIGAVIRWYASISSGLCPADLTAAPMQRLDGLLQRINSPELRLSAAVQEIVRLHASLMSDPVLPSFNGILARLILRYHLGRCGLPPVFFHPDTPPLAMTSARTLLPLVMEQLEHSYDLMVG